MNSIIRLDKVSKSFEIEKKEIQALDNVSLEIEKGSIYGIIGMSGAGKSTLIRTLNYLEKPDSGKVFIDNKELSTLNSKELRFIRRDMAMVFQHFNLLMQKNVLDNVCLPMLSAKVPKSEAIKRAKEMLEIVDLSEKISVYPSQLSGGQKQRVAIARALASRPKLLLCDEATSALDPNTTATILDLLKKINKDFGITIVIITHEMSVVERICTHVAILDKGRLAESGTVKEIFEHPKSAEGKKLILNDVNTVALMNTSNCIRIAFTENSSFEPVVANMVLTFKYPVNILYANTCNINSVAQGEMILQLPDDEEIQKQMINYLGEHKLSVETLDIKEVL